MAASISRALVGLALAIAPAVAQAQTSVEVSPMRAELQAVPGASTTQAISLTNVGGAPVRVKATLTDWYLSRDGSPQFDDPNIDRSFSAASWVRFAPPEFVLEAGHAETVRFTVSVPTGVEAGSYRAAILFDFIPLAAESAANARQVRFKSRIATLIYVNVGQAVAAVELTDLRVREAESRREIVATLKNTSRRSIRTKGSLVLYDVAGSAVREVAMPDVPVLPESEREVAIQTSDAISNLPEGSYRVEVKIDVGLSAVLVGETTLKVAR